MAGRGRPSRATVYTRLDRAIRELHHRSAAFPAPQEAQEIWADIWHLEAHHSTALEGNTLVLREVQALLDQGRAVGAKPLREYNEVQGYAAAARWVYGQALEPDAWHDGRLIMSQRTPPHSPHDDDSRLGCGPPSRCHGPGGARQLP